MTERRISAVIEYCVASAAFVVGTLLTYGITYALGIAAWWLILPVGFVIAWVIQNEAMRYLRQRNAR